MSAPATHGPDAPGGAAAGPAVADATAPTGPATGARAALAIRNEAEFLADELQAARAGTWDALGRLFARAPDPATLDALANLAPPDPGDGPVAMGWEVLRRAAIEAREAGPAALEEEYLDLFIGRGQGEVVPFGSWYLTGFLMEKPLALLRGDLARLGIERGAGVPESEDHVAALAEAMAHVVRASGEIDLATQRAFFDDHVAPWMGRCFADVQAAPSARFYRAAGFLGEAVVDFERELLAMRD